MIGLLTQSATAVAMYYGFYRAYAWLLRKRLTPEAAKLYATAPYLSRLVASTNAVLLTVGATLFLLGNLAPGPAAFLLQATPIGYCLYDLFLMSAEPEIFDPVMMGHHLVFAYFPAFVFASYSSDVALAYLSESSLPFLHLCWFLIRAGRTESRVFRGSAALLLVSFFVFRVCVFAWLTYKAFVLESQYAAGVGIGALTALNSRWFLRLAAKASEDAPSDA